MARRHCIGRPIRRARDRKPKPPTFPTPRRVCRACAVNNLPEAKRKVVHDRSLVGLGHWVVCWHVHVTEEKTIDQLLGRDQRRRQIHDIASSSSFFFLFHFPVYRSVHAYVDYLVFLFKGRTHGRIMPLRSSIPFPTSNASILSKKNPNAIIWTCVSQSLIHGTLVLALFLNVR